MRKSSAHDTPRLIARLLPAVALAGCPGARAQQPGSAAWNYLQALTRFETYAESVWHPYLRIEGAGYFGDGLSKGNGGIRGSCGIALAYAVLVHAQPGDEANARRLARIEAALRFAARTHRIGPAGARAADGKKWGRSWQSGLWAGSLGLAAFLMRSKLPGALVEECRAVLADEADHRSTRPPASGYRGNTRAEENAWNSNAPALAAAWLREHPHRDRWLATAKRYLVNTYTVAADAAGPFSGWVSSVNLYPDYTLENHGFYHPAYHMVSGMSMGDSYLMAKLIDPEVARELRPFAEHNVLKVWSVLQRMVLANGEFSYPSGMDWALHSYGQVGYYPFLATHFRDGRAATAELELSRLLLQRQKVNGDGSFLGGSLKNSFYSEAVRARRIAMAWLHHKSDGFAATDLEPLARSFLAHLKGVRILVHKTPRAYVSVSYGRKIMMLVLPAPGPAKQAAFVVAPQEGSLIGNTPLGRARTARLLEYLPGDGGFRATLEVEAERGALLYTIASQPEFIALIQRPRPGAGAVRPARSCFHLSIENHPLTGGRRRLQTPAGERDVLQMSAAAFDIEPPWCAVSGRLGLIFGPGGSARYECAPGYNRKGAAVDLLCFRPDHPLEPAFAILVPEPDMRQLRRLRQSISWSSRGGAAALEFHSPSGERVRLSAGR